MAAGTGMNRRAVVTGIGVVTACGRREATWDAVQQGRSALRWLDELPAAPFAPGRWAGAPAPTSPAAHRPAHVGLALEAAEEALADANAVDTDGRAGTGSSLSSPIDRGRFACIVGTSKGSLPPAFGHGAPSGGCGEGSDWLCTWPHAASQAVAERWRLRGPRLAPVAACATGLVCIERAARLISEGDCDVALAGSADASLHPLWLAAYHRLGVQARLDSAADPRRAVRAFDVNRSGFLVGEGAAVLVLEAADHARRRRARVYAEILAGGSAGDPRGLVQVDAAACSLIGLTRAVLARAEVDPAEVDYVNLHGTATRDNDVAEAAMLRSVFGSELPPSSSLKGTLGHLLGAAGSVELAMTLLALRDGVLPPTINLHEPDPSCALNHIASARRVSRHRTALKISLGFGGHLAAVVVRRED